MDWKLRTEDVLLQKQLPYGSLWSEEGVYRIAKELPLQHPEKFCNIFLRRISLRKSYTYFCGSYLEQCGIESVFVENGIFGASVVKSVMNGSNYYVRGKDGYHWLLKLWGICSCPHFGSSVTYQSFNMFLKISLIKVACEQLHLSVSKCSAWRMEQTFWWNFEIWRRFNGFRKHGCEKSESFLYWEKFINDLTSSFHEGDWNLRLSSIYRAIPLCFAFDHVNYKRWLPLYYEDCLALEQKYPEIHASFLKDDFAIQHSCKKSKYCAYRPGPFIR